MLFVKSNEWDNDRDEKNEHSFVYNVESDEWENDWGEIKA